MPEPVDASAAPPAAEPMPASPQTAVEATLAIPDDAERTRAFRDARRAERSGTPLDPPKPPDPTPETIAAPPETEERKLSKRQIADNDRTRAAVDLATADLRAEVARLKAERAPAPPAEPKAQPASPQTAKYPTYAEALQKNPDLTHEDYLDARWTWNTQQAEFARQRATFEKADLDRQVAISTSASERYAAAVKADPTFEASLDPALMAIPTRELVIANKQPILPENDFATALLESEVMPQLLRHISATPAVMEKVRKLDSRAAVLRYFGQLEAKFLPDPDAPAAAPAPAAASPPKTLTTASEPPVTLSARPAGPSDPIAAALSETDEDARTRAFRAAKRAQGR